MKKTTATTIAEYNKLQEKNAKNICNVLAIEIDKHLKKSESKIWHGSPVWFLDGNPIVAYSTRKNGNVSLMFFSGQGFGEKELKPEGSFKAAEIFYTDEKEIRLTQLKKWLKKAKEIQWDYKNIAKTKGVLKKIVAKKAGTVSTTKTHDMRITTMTFALVYPLYLKKVEKKGRTKEELHQVITWLTGFNNKKLQTLIKEKVTFDTFFKEATLHKHAHRITGSICGYRIEEIKNPLTKKVRYLDKLVDELARGRSMEKILRTE